MSDSQQPSLKLEQKLEAEDLLYTTLFHTGDRKIWWTALGIAFVLHVGVMLLRLPEFKSAISRPTENRQTVVVRKYVPPPPQIERKPQIVKQLTKKIPIPDPTPDEPEPIREPEPEIEPEPLPPDTEFLIGVPEAPPAPEGPLLAGVGGVTTPERIPESYVEPVFPEIARRARIDGNVILQAVIHKDGTVGEIKVLRINRPAMGFEQSAIEAVRQWRYRPGTQGGRPVDVYLTVKVEFTLQ